MLSMAAEGSIWLRDPWLLLGLAGQTLFGLRFLVQWIATEKSKRVVVPIAFWWLSLAGAALTTLYGLLMGLIPVLIGQLPGFVVYSRNLAIHYAHMRASSGA